MKIKVKETKHVSNQVGQKTKVAEMGDVDIIVDLLRKHYANPRQTVVQEYLCNARDAHRECNQSKAIEVSLPTKKQPVMKIRDFGNKMSIERLENNFLNYGSSTKRDSNTQTGGFGIGSKSAWVYTPTFFIRVISEGVETLFEASTAKHYRGALTTIFSKATTEADGVEIQIPVQAGDIEHFHNAFYRATYFWTEAVKVINLMEDEIYTEWLKKDYYRKDNFYFLNLSSSFKEFCSDVNIRLPSSWAVGSVVVDGIPYPAPGNMKELGDKVNFVFPKIETGELTISISREAIEEIDSNAKVLKDKATQAHFQKESLEVRAAIVQKITPTEKLDWPKTLEHFDSIFGDKKEDYQILRNFPYSDYNMMTGRFENATPTAKSLWTSNIHRIRYWYNVPGLQTTSFYKTMRSSYAWDKKGIKTPSARPKIFINDGRESANMIDSLIKYQTKHAVIGNVDLILVINNASDPRVKAFVETTQAPNLSPVLATLKQGVHEVKNSGVFKGGRVQVQNAVIRNKENCLKKGFRYGTELSKLNNSESLLTEYPEYIIGNWDEEKEVNELAKLNDFIEDRSDVRIILVSTNDLKFFTEKKFLTIENYKKGKFLRKMRSDMTKVLSIIEGSGNGNVYSVGKMANCLNIVKIDMDGSLYDWFRDPPSFKAMCKNLEVEADKVVVRKLNKIVTNAGFKYYEPYLNKNYEKMKKADRDFFLKVFKV